MRYAKYMDSMQPVIRIHGGRVLSGQLTVQGSKNAFHKVLGAIVRWPGRYRLWHVPPIQDAQWLIEQFEHVGGRVSRNGDSMTFDSRSIQPRRIGPELAERSSGTILFAGAFLARFGEVEIAPPGGDKIGFRPIDYHLAAFTALGVSLAERDGHHVLTAAQLHAADFTFPGRTVNGTINAILAATGATGITTLRGCVIESDILDAIAFMNQLGARVTVTDPLAGVITVAAGQPKAELEYSLVADRNVTATLAVAGALAGRELVIRNINTADTRPLWALFDEIGQPYRLDEAAAELTLSRADLHAPGRVIEGHIPPLFSTDWAPMVQVLLTQIPGQTEYHEMVFSNRFAHVPHLVHMGAQAQLHDSLHDRWVAGESFREAGQYDRCRYTGPAQLHGASVAAHDIRQAAALVLAGLIAEGDTVIREAVHVRRGYGDLVALLRSVGADLAWVDDPAT